MGDEVPGGDAEQDGSAEATGGDDDADHDAGKKLERSLGCTQGVGKHVPAHLGAGGGLPGCLGRQRSHDSSCSAGCAPPTVWRKISSNVSFPADARSWGWAADCAWTPARSSSSEPWATSCPR